jgi:hypothetical protein
MPQPAREPIDGAVGRNLEEHDHDEDTWFSSDASMPGGNVSARRKSRKRALDVLYQADLRDESIRRTLESYIALLPEPRPEHLSYTVRLVEGVMAHLDRIDEMISSYAEGWTLDRMPVVDRNLARTPRRWSSPARCRRTTPRASSTAFWAA